METHMFGTLSIDAGQHLRDWCPVIVDAGAGAAVAPAYASDNGDVLAVQQLSDGQAALIIPTLRTGERLELRPLCEANLDINEASLVTATLESPGVLAIYDAGRLVTRYRFGNDVVRPFFYPVHSPDGSRLTRSYPMERVAGEHQDHPHHKSIWIAHGDVNGTDNWSEEPGHGGTANIQLEVLDQGPVLARFQAKGLWHTASDEPLLTEILTVSVWRSNGYVRYVDYQIVLTADQPVGDVTFGDTKEGGILSVRVASAMDGRNGGHISNVFGGRMEAECWGKPSHYCSYWGSVGTCNGGIAILDRPDSFRSPVTWHVRNYGLMTANPFGLESFTNGARNGSCTLKAGSSFEFHYRMVLHNIAGFTGDCSAMYLDYAFPPNAVFTSQSE
jgi:Methane oxygenase PmoA